jgi:nucleotide-binding universal stress UspA family protein
MIRSVLVALKPDENELPCIQFALALAERRRLLIDGLAVIDVDQFTHTEPVPLGASSFKADLDEQHMQQARQRAVANVKALKEGAQARGIVCEAQTVEGKTADEIARAVHRADLLICGHTTQADARELAMLASILKHSPRPSIVVPESPPEGNAALVAYDGSFQSARALASFAQSGLAAGHEVTVLALNDDLELARERGEAAAMFLKRHQVSAAVRAELSHGAPADQILEEAAKLSAGLLVMGAFGKGAVHEFFFGSATNDVLRKLPLPVFLDH